MSSSRTTVPSTVLPGCGAQETMATDTNASHSRAPTPCVFSRRTIEPPAQTWPELRVVRGRAGDRPPVCSSGRRERRQLEIGELALRRKVFVERVQPGHVLRRDLEVEHVEVLALVLHVVGLGQ